MSKGLLPRWADRGSSSSPEVRRLMRAAAAQQPDQQIMDSLEGRLGQLLAPTAPPEPSAPPGATGAPGAGLIGPTLKLVVGCVVLAGAAAIYWGYFGASHGASVELSIRSVSNPSAIELPDDEATIEPSSSGVDRRAQESSTPIPEQTVVSAEVVAELPPHRVNSSRSRSTTVEDEHGPVAPLVVDESSTIAEEARLLKQARRRLASSPVGALELTEQHRSTYSPGLLIQEREMIAIEALARSGQRSRAQRRAQAFRSRYPSSSYRTRLDVLERRFGLLEPSALVSDGDTEDQP